MDHKLSDHKVSAENPSLHIPSQEELEILKKYMGKFSWSTFFSGTFSILLFLVSTALTFAGSVPIWLGSSLNILAFFLIFETLHSSIHGHIAGRHKNLKWVDRVVGGIAGTIVQLGFKGWQEHHEAHHSNTNVKGVDPTYARLHTHKDVFKFAFLSYVLMQLYPIPFIGPRVIKKRIPASRVRYFQQQFPDSWVMQIRINYICMIALIAAGFGWHVLFLWVLPTLIQRARLTYLFQWSPHQNLTDTNPFRATTVHIRPFGLDRVYFRQVGDYHLIHHLYPGAPCHKLRRIFLDVHDILEANGSPIIYGWSTANKTGIKSKSK